MFGIGSAGSLWQPSLDDLSGPIEVPFKRFGKEGMITDKQATNRELAIRLFVKGYHDVRLLLSFI